MNKTVPNESISSKQLEYIKTYHAKVGNGSESICYHLNSKTLIKLFNDWCKEMENKLYLPQEYYGNSTYLFIYSKIYHNEKLIGYTMPFVSGKRPTQASFNALPYETLLSFLEIVIKDSKDMANKGIYTYDTFLTNIILSSGGFKSIDSIDYQQTDEDPKIITKKNIRAFCVNIWDYLLDPESKVFCTRNKLKGDFLCENPIEFFKELKRIAMNIADVDIITLNDTKKLVKRK